jgi:zinc transporter 1
VFLVALCLSIFLEAIQRFVEPQTVSHPQLVLIVGSFGLLSNILGLFLFHDHGHSHGHGNPHTYKSDDLVVAEEGHAHGSDFESPTYTITDENGRVADILPQSITLNGQTTAMPYTNSHDENPRNGGTSPSPHRKSDPSCGSRLHHRRTSVSRTRLASADDINIHPARFRNDIIAASRFEDIESGSGSESEDGITIGEPEANDAPTETTHLLRPGKLHKSTSPAKFAHGQDSTLHSGHNHRRPKKDGEKSGSHSHGDLNMRGVFLHVLGDALGNVGVIASALFIWLTEFSWRFYSDPAISLIITIIILGSAIPLCRAAARILLQAVPVGLNVDDIKADIESIDGIVSCHDLHVWQLNDTKLVASLHVQVSFDFKGEGSARYMGIARAIRTCLHEYGIHSSTIQPEFCLDQAHGRDDGHSNTPPPPSNDGNPSLTLAGTGQSGLGNDTLRGSRGPSKTNSKAPSRTASTRSGQDACLLTCNDECSDGNQCCIPAQDSEHQHEH